MHRIPLALTLLAGLSAVVVMADEIPVTVFPDGRYVRGTSGDLQPRPTPTATPAPVAVSSHRHMDGTHYRVEDYSEAYGGGCDMPVVRMAARLYPT